jgi:phosphate transport system permease protein
MRKAVRTPAGLGRGVPWWVSAAGAAVVPGALLGILVVLGVYAWPSVLWNGLAFFTGKTWSLGNLYGSGVVRRFGQVALQGAAFGALPYLVATLVSSLLALALATVVGVGVAVALAERAPRAWGSVLGFFVELLAGVPSVVFGLWGLMVVAPWIQDEAGPWIARLGGWVPWLRGPVTAGTGLLAAVLVLAVMLLPLIASLGRDALRRVPADLRDQGRALGLTEWEILRDLVLPEAAPGILGAVVLAFGRAVGETMAVLMVSGGGSGLPTSIFSPVTTMAAAIVADLDSALTDPTGMAVHALAELAVVLLVISVLVNLVAPLAGRGASVARAVLGPRGEGR